MVLNWRRWALVAAAGVLYYSGLLRLALFFRRVILRKQEVCVLALHRILSDEERSRTNSLDGMVLREVTFTKMLAFLQRDFRVISLEEFLCAGEQNQGDSRPRCLLTFDDGWRDNYTRAYPILRKFNSSATIFLVTEMVGTTGGFWVERLRNTWKNPSERRRMIPVVAERLASRNGGPEINLEDVVEYLKHLPAQERNGLLERLLPSPETEEAANDLDRMMTWEEAAELARNGVELGAHTATHPILTHEDNATVCHELTTCKETLEEKLARPARAFAYPNGNWNEGVRAQVERAGFQCAFTTRRRWYCPGDDPFTIPRFIIHEKKISGLDGEFSPALFSLTLARWA